MAENKKEVYNSPVYYRELGQHLKQREEYARSLRYFDITLNSKPEDIRALLRRASARAKAMKTHEALLDINKIIDQHPEDISAIGAKALILYLNCEFEDALIQNYRAVPRRIMPNNFVLGIMHCENAIKNCLAERAGHPLRDYYLHIRKLAWFKSFQEQRVYKPVASNRKKKKITMTRKLPSGEPKAIKVEKAVDRDYDSFDEFESRKSSTQVYDEESSILDSVNSHQSSLVHLLKKVPKGPSYPYRPLQQHTTNMDMYLAERYLETLYKDKEYLQSLPKMAGTILNSKTNCNKLQELSGKCLRKVERCQNILRTRRPFYFIKYQMNTAYGKLRTDTQHARQCIENQVKAQADAIYAKLTKAVQNKKIKLIQEVAEKFFSFYELTDKGNFPNREECKLNVVKMVGEGLYESAKFSKEMTTQQKNEKVKMILGLSVEKVFSFDSVTKSPIAWRTDWNKMRRTYENRLNKASTIYELAWLYHELSRFAYELKDYEYSHLYAQKSVSKASSLENKKWAVNALIMKAKTGIKQKDKGSALTSMSRAKKIVTKMEDDDKLEYINKCLIAIEESAKEDAVYVKMLEARKKQMLKLLTSDAMKLEATQLFDRIASMPSKRQIAVLPGVPIDDPTRDKNKSTDSSTLSSISDYFTDENRGLNFLNFMRSTSFSQ